MVGNGQITHNFFGFRKNLYKIGFLGIYRKCDPRQFLLTVNNCDSIQKSCLLQQLIGAIILPLLCDFGTAILEIIASDLQLQIKLASK